MEDLTLAADDGGEIGACENACAEHARCPTTMPEISDPRTFPDSRAAQGEPARLHGLAAHSQIAETGQQAAAFDTEIRGALSSLLAPARGKRLEAVFATAPTPAIYRHLWRLLAQCAPEPAAVGHLKVTVFALPVVIVAGLDAGPDASATLPCVLGDTAALAEILRGHGALAGNQSFALANALVATGAIDLAQLPDLLSWSAFPESAPIARALEPAPILLAGGPETVHLRYLVGSALAAPGADLLGRTDVGKWGMPFEQALGRQLGAPGITLLALPRAPQSLLQAVRQGRAAQREVGAQIFATNAIRRLRAAVGEPTAVISAHHCPGAINGGEVRLSLSSPFDPREAEGFRCPLYPAETVDEVVAMLIDFLNECRVADVRVVPGVHGDRDPATGLPLLFKGDDARAAVMALH
jgi:hypothetical protein